MLWYLKGTVNYDIHYKRNGDSGLLALINSDYLGDIEDIKSTSDYVFLLNSGALVWG